MSRARPSRRKISKASERKHAGMFSYPSRVFMPREPAPAQQGMPVSGWLVNSTPSFLGLSNSSASNLSCCRRKPFLTLRKGCFQVSGL